MDSDLIIKIFVFLIRMSHTQAESVIKNIIREIAQECAEKGHTVSETMVAFVVSYTCVLFLQSKKLFCF